MPLILIAVLLAAFPSAGYAHAKGLYGTRQQAQQRAKELGCPGTHQNNGKWMPCRDEATLHMYLRHQ